jgi:hypothetical protein
MISPKFFEAEHQHSQPDNPVDRKVKYRPADGAGAVVTGFVTLHTLCFRRQGVLSGHRVLRRPGESYSDVIVKLAQDEGPG